MEKIIIGNYIGTDLSANDPGKLLSYYHQQYPCSNVLTLLYLKMLEDERPKEYEKSKSELLLSVYNRNKFHQYQLSRQAIGSHLLSEENKTTDTQSDRKETVETVSTPAPISEVTDASLSEKTRTDNAVIEEVRKLVERKPEENAESENDNSAKDYDQVVTKNFDAPTINLEEDQSTVIDSLIAKFGGNPPTIKKSILIHEPLANYSEGSLDEDEDIISETLAIIYAEQGYPGKATRMLQKLSLIFPEKSSIFASHIERIKNGKYNHIN
ncbi:MAG: hypothetical protein J5644_06820 [Bacteroidales bacterium]|nr:hypothetical protein [Bacteroidales bacterium]